jgi:hypothetical protein
VPKRIGTGWLMPPVAVGGAEDLLTRTVLPVVVEENRRPGLERRRGVSGHDRVDHGRGAHHDRANAVAGVVSLLTPRDPSDLGITIGNLR